MFLLDGSWSFGNVISGIGYERRFTTLVGESNLAVYEYAMNGDDGMHCVWVSFSFLLW